MSPSTSPRARDPSACGGAGLPWQRVVWHNTGKMRGLKLGCLLFAGSMLTSIPALAQGDSLRKAASPIAEQEGVPQARSATRTLSTYLSHKVVP